ncbi:hypothetical protein L2E82_22985 [Cichorium intybus]|uniref:Uncharacterized protein n=1 Tax=Cichorium intybus TaxID=13427 RepID=A0ACB9DZZ7_CICIN|nr:hypothetical protein L2E82_22985 [Cichorium intybus]
MQHTTLSQPQSQPLQTPLLFKPQATLQSITQQPYQPQPSQYQYQEAEQSYEDEEEGWVPQQQPPQQQWNRGRGPPRRAPQQQPPQGQQGYNDHQYPGNVVRPLYFAQPRGQSVASHFQPREYNDSSPIYIPDDIDSQVKIRPQLLGILPEFRGYKQDDPYNHLYEFMAIANTNTPRNTNKNIFRLRLFPFTLKDKANKTTKIWRAIQNFQQKPGEAFHEALYRLKELMRSCPHHDIPKWQLVRHFFEGATETNQAMINASSSGTIMMMDPDEEWQLLEQLSNGSKANFSTRKTVDTAAVVGADADWRKEAKRK